MTYIDHTMCRCGCSKQAHKLKKSGRENCHNCGGCEAFSERKESDPRVEEQRQIQQQREWWRG